MTFRERLSSLKKPCVYVALGLLIGASLVLGIRFATYAPEHVHYHANFSVYINGEREEFKDPKYYQEVAICMAGQGITVPEARAHIHDNDNTSIHIHDHAVTWNQLFNNLGWNIGSDYIVTDAGTVYKENASDKLHIYINNQDYTGLTNLTNTVIKDKDRLLISYGNLDDVTLLQEAKTVATTAAKLDASQDPATCAGNEKITLKNRFKHLF